MDVAWESLNVRSDAKAESKVILHGLCGRVKRGNLIAVMGPTGSGKTTLLNCLARRLDEGLNYSGTVRYDQRVFDKDTKSRVGFVEQDDIVMDVLTVRQSLRFMAELRLPDTVPDAVKVEKCEAVIARLRLNKAADSKVADVSGGERKRLCIAQEPLVEPQLILLDEPTSGLDSTTARLVVEYIQELSGEFGVSIVCTIHQPSSHVFHMFDDLILLADGRTVYRGKSSDAVTSLTV